MRWILITCVLLATITNVLSGHHRPKRHLNYIKNLIVEKLFGKETIFIQQPAIPKNETYQLFKIKGYDNILVKVKNKPKKKTKKHNFKEKVQDPVIVGPEIAIIGSYLGTTTQGDTQYALEIVKNMIKSGILNSETDKLIQKVADPVAAKSPHLNHNPYNHVRKDNEFIKDPNYLLMPGQAEGINIVNSNSVPIALDYPPLAAVSGLKAKPEQIKYSYTQKGETADMTYESYNNKDVIVTRTDKQPPLPQYITLRFAEVASIGSNPYTIQSQQPDKIIAEEHLVNLMPNQYSLHSPSSVIQKNIQANAIPSYIMGRYPTAKPPRGLVDDSKYVFVTNSVNNPTIAVNKNSAFSSESPIIEPNFIEQSKPPFDIRNHLTDAEIDKINTFINIKLNQTKNTHNAVSLKHSTSDTILENTMESNEKDTISYEKIINNSRTINVDKSMDNVIKEFVFMPPNDIDIPPPNMIPKTNNINHQNKNDEDISSGIENYSKQVFDKSIMKTSEQHLLKNDPIVVLEDKSDQIMNTVRTFKGRTPGYKPFTGGPVFK